MTADEKRIAISNRCSEYDKCGNCPLYEHTNGIGCHSSLLVNDEQLEKNYRIMFDINEHTSDDLTLVIKIKSSRKIDSININFKEED